ncbi:HtpX Zn-dependent protease with chaperone function [Rhabdaerophilaceae bacterium]
MIGEAFGLYTHIQRNRLRSMVLIAGLFLLVVMLTFGVTLIIDGQLRYASLGDHMVYAAQKTLVFAPVSLILTGIWVMIAFSANVAMIGWATGAAPLTREQSPRLWRLTENLCISRGMAVPKLAIIDTDALNAYASGVNESQYTVTVTRGLMETLDDAELEAVIAHELTHIRNGDVKLMIIAVLVAGVVSFFGEMLVRSQRFSNVQVTHRGSDSEGRGSGKGAAVLVGIGIIVLAWILAVVIRFALSRSREYLADAGAVELTKNPDAMISALLKISGRADIPGVPSGVMDMCIENDPNDFADIFSTHPSIAKRVNALQAYAGGIMPPQPPRMRERQPLPQIVEKSSPWNRPPV